MKKFRILVFVLLLVVFIGGAGYFVVTYFDTEKGQEEELYFGETSVMEINSFDEFASEIVELVKKYDGEKIDQEAFLDPYFSRRLIVQGTGENLDLTSYGAKIVVRGPDDMYVVQFTTREAAEDACAKLQGAENIEYCEPDQYVACSESGESNEAMSWGAEQVGACMYAEHIKNVTDESITVAVVDTGVYEHSFLKDRIMAGGMDFIDNDMRPDDENSHGTHVAGTIVDCTPELNVMILPVRVLGTNGFGSALSVSLGIRYAANIGAQVMNLSLWTNGGTNQTIDNAVTYAVHRGCIVVTIAGNANQDVDEVSPGHLDECIVVSAVNSNLKKADFSNWGNSVDFSAPGVDIVSCVPKFLLGHAIGETTKSEDGTSMAAPHITALAAMIKLENPVLTADEVQETIKEHCIDLGEPGWDPYYGWGIPDFSGAVDDGEMETIESDATELNSEESDSDGMEIWEVFPQESAQTDPMDAYANVLAEYKMLAESNFDSSLLGQIQYANEGVWNFSGQDQYLVYYRLADLAGDGEPELLVSINKKGTPYNIVDIFGLKNGEPVEVIESNGSVGYRSRYYITIDGRIKNVGSGGALNTRVSYYRLTAGSVVPELEDQYIYDGWDGDKYTHIDSLGSSESLSKDEYGYMSSNQDVDFTSEWILLYDRSSAQQTEYENKETAQIPIRTIPSKNNLSAGAYQGIFMKGDTFISLPLYTGIEPGEAIGVVYQVTKPVWNENGYINSDIIDTLGEIYDLGPDAAYEIQGEGGNYGLSYSLEGVTLEGGGSYNGNYVMVSNSGANMDMNDIWLNIPDYSGTE